MLCLSVIIHFYIFHKLTSGVQIWSYRLKQTCSEHQALKGYKKLLKKPLDWFLARKTRTLPACVVVHYIAYS